MDTKHKQYIEKLIEDLDILQKIRQETVKYWEPDDALINGLLGDLGTGFVEYFDKFSEKGKEHFFHIIEEGMLSKDEDLSTAVATGAIEAMLIEAYKIEGLFEKVNSYFKEESKAYAQAWWNRDYSDYSTVKNT